MLCSECNNHFSGDIQENAKPALLNLIAGNAVSPENYFSLYEWLALFALRSGFETNQGPMPDRELCNNYYSGNRTNFDIFVGWCSESSTKLAYLRSFRFKKVSDIFANKSLPEIAYTNFEQTTCIQIGKFIAYVIIRHDLSQNIIGNIDFEYIGRELALEAGLVELGDSTPFFWPNIDLRQLHNLSAKMLRPDERDQSLSLAT